MTFKIYKDIPLPARKHENDKYALGRLEIGELTHLHMSSFPGLEAREAQRNVSSRAAYITKCTGKKFATRVIAIDDVPGIGVWRTA